MAFEWLRCHADLYDSSPRALVHGDYGLNNLLIEGDRVTGILDWEHAHIGNPAYDLGYFHPMAAALASWPSFLDAYANTGVHMPDEKQIDFSILLGATRVGVMLCQVMSAFTSDQETGIAATTGIAGDYYDVAVLRISNALEKVL
jgi:aminoglycoside phosphotransferase (APT) family kinase protein